MADLCTDNRFELIEKYKQKLIEDTNIEMSPDEMKVLDSILFRFWQMGWLDKLEQPTAQQWIPCSEHPDTERNVFIARGKTELLSCCIGHYDHNAKLWYEDRNWFAKIMYDAMYWCEMPPLPEPWKGEQE